VDAQGVEISIAAGVNEVCTVPDSGDDPLIVVEVALVEAAREPLMPAPRGTEVVGDA
jgi:hypothetical protein